MFDDGSARILRDALSLETIQPLMTRNGGEVIENFGDPNTPVGNPFGSSLKYRTRVYLAAAS